VNRTEYERSKNDLSTQFLIEKRDGVIPVNTGWAEWCWQNGVYPLTDETPAPAQETERGR
jgi:hypothetical protein